MFTGIIENLGECIGAQPAERGLRLSVRPAQAWRGLTVGESIAVNGVCLTLETGSTPEALRFFLSQETLNKTTLGRLRPGALLNLERALRVGDALGGHVVSGHVDGIGTIRRLQPDGEAFTFEVAHPPVLTPLLAPKGSVCVDGISLTIVESLPTYFSVALIPHTVAATRLRTLAPGDAVNLEADPLARYVMHALRALQGKGGASAEPAAQSERMHDLLQRAGFRAGPS